MARARKKRRRRNPSFFDAEAVPWGAKQQRAARKSRERDARRHYTDQIRASVEREEHCRTVARAARAAWKACREKERADRQHFREMRRSEAVRRRERSAERAKVSTATRHAESDSLARQNIPAEYWSLWDARKRYIGYSMSPHERAERFMQEVHEMGESGWAEWLNEQQEAADQWARENDPWLRAAV